MPDEDTSWNSAIEAAARACEDMAPFRAREGSAALRFAAEQIRALRKDEPKDTRVIAKRARAERSRTSA